ncbi:MAG: SDR family NAD(P)-dependent oxidoreductase [Acetobacteraceae bacterium]|nr:SDR family NAD(P)-dependent oxidoreductase [Acetobacteraceae bacterium]
MARELAAGPAFAAASHWLITTPPDEAGDPVLRRHAAALASGNQRWIGYLSTTGVYGDRGGGTVDEATAPAPDQPRSQRRLAAEEAWRAARPAHAALDLCRVGGIYGPGRAPFAELRAGIARRVVKPGHSFSRIHRDDIAHAIMAAISNPPEPGCRVLNFVDDEPADSAAVMAEAARLLGMPPPPVVPFEEARAAMSPMALSFWSENRRVANAATKAALGIEWRYPSYREGLAASLAEERR